MCLTNADNNLEKQLDADSEPCSFKPILAHLMKAREGLPVTHSLRRLRGLPRVRSSLIAPSDVCPPPSSPHGVRSFGVCACNLVLWDVREEEGEKKREKTHTKKGGIMSVVYLMKAPRSRWTDASVSCNGIKCGH